MAMLKSFANTDSEFFANNRTEMLGLLAEFRSLEDRVQALSASRRARFEKRGQMLPRERLAYLLDRGRLVSRKRLKDIILN